MCLSTALDYRPAIRFATARAIGCCCSFEDRIPAPGPPRMQLVEFLECLNTIMVETYIEWLLSRLCAAVKQAMCRCQASFEFKVT